MLLYDLSRRHQPDACSGDPPAYVCRPLETLEEVRLIGSGYSDSMVRNCHDCPAAVAGDGKCDIASSGAVLGGVAKQVVDHTHEAPFVPAPDQLRYRRPNDNAVPLGTRLLDARLLACQRHQVRRGEFESQAAAELKARDVQQLVDL